MQIITEYKKLFDNSFICLLFLSLWKETKTEQQEDLNQLLGALNCTSYIDFLY